MPDLLEKLVAHFHPDEIEWRIGSTSKDKKKGLALAYIDARVVMDRLDSVCGPDGWQNRYPHAGVKTCCEIGIKVNDEWIWKADGAGDTNVEANKGAFSDAFKRAAVKWGIGRYLYDVKSPWVELEPRGSTHVIKSSEYTKLRKLVDSGNLEDRPVKQRDIMAGVGTGEPEDTLPKSFDIYNEVEEIIDTANNVDDYLQAITDLTETSGIYWPANRKLMARVGNYYKSRDRKLYELVRRTYDFGMEAHKNYVTKQTHADQTILGAG